MIAIPYALDYQLRSKIAEGVSLAGPLKNLVTEYYQTNNQLPLDNDALHVPPELTFSGNWTDSIVVTNVPSPGTIVVRFDNLKLPQLEGNNTLLLSPTANNGHLTWHCGGGTLDRRLRPSSCRDE